MNRVFFPGLTNIGKIFIYIQLLLPINSIAIPTSVIEGSITFPSTVAHIPPIRIYYCGKRISYRFCDINNVNKQFRFQIPKSQYQRQFMVLITDPANLQFNILPSKDGECQNTIGHIQIKPQRPYKYYLVKQEQDQEKNLLDEYASVLKNTGTAIAPNYKWIIQSQKIMNGTIPDETIIICYAPHCVADIKEIATTELPTIQMKENLLSLIGGTESSFKQFSDKFTLAALDMDTIHAPMRHDNIKREAKRTIIAPSA